MLIKIASLISILIFLLHQLTKKKKSILQIAKQLRSETIINNCVQQFFDIIFINRKLQNFFHDLFNDLKWETYFLRYQNLLMISKLLVR